MAAPLIVLYTIVLTLRIENYVRVYKSLNHDGHSSTATANINEMTNVSQVLLASRFKLIIGAAQFTGENT